MSSMLDKIAISRGCPNCTTILRNGCNMLILCQAHKDELKARDEAADNLTLDDYIKEVVNGRLDVRASSKWNYALYEKYMDSMPYGTAKARDGDPDEFIYYALMDEYEHLIEEEETV